MNSSPPAKARVQGLSEVPFEFLNAKLRGRRSRLYEGDRLRELVGLGNLGDLAYELFPRRDIRTQGDLEMAVTEVGVGELASFLPYLSGRRRSLHSALLDRYVVENLKVLWRLRGEEDAERRASELLVPLPEDVELPVEALLAAEDELDFAERVPLERPRQAALEALPLPEGPPGWAYMEMALDRGYWEGVAGACRGLAAGEQAASCRPIVVEHDAMRLLAVLRAARLYELPWAQLAPLLPSGWGELDEDRLRAIYSDPEPERLLEQVPALRRSVESPEQAQSIGRVEEALWAEAVRLADRQYYGSLSGPAVLVSYWYLKRNEMKRLMRLGQMLRLGIEKRRITERLGL